MRPRRRSAARRASSATPRYRISVPAAAYGDLVPAPGREARDPGQFRLRARVARLLRRLDERGAGPRWLRAARARVAVGAHAPARRRDPARADARPSRARDERGGARGSRARALRDRPRQLVGVHRLAPERTAIPEALRTDARHRALPARRAQWGR